MRRNVALVACVVVALLAPLAIFAQDVPLRNWTVPSISTTSSSASWVARPEAETNTSGAIFYGLAPCRILDTREAVGPFGGPKYAAGETRSYTIPSAPNCPGIPAAAAYSLNFTIIAYEGDGFLTAYPSGGVRPIVSTLNFGAGTIIANAAVVPANISGAISVYAFNPTHIIVDINGYYMDNHTSTPGTHFRVIVNEPNSLGAIFANNINNTAATSAIYGYLQSNTQNGSSAVRGDATGATGKTAGVAGFNNSTSGQAAGVYGEIGNPAAISNTFVAGVYGLAGTSGLVDTGVWGSGIDRGVSGYQCVPACGSGGVVGFAPTVGLHSFGDITAGGTKSFIEPHPTDASKQIVYIALEGGEAGTYFRGRGRFVNGRAVINVPEDFRLVTDEEGLTVQITPLGRMAQVGVISADLNAVLVEGSRDVEFSYLVQGVRSGFADRRPIQENVFFVPNSPDDHMENWPESVKATLVNVGIYNADGTVNMQTAERMGWTKVWAEKARAAQH